jgi:hypothetical protein
MRARPARLAKQVQERKKVLAYLASLPADARKSLQRLRRDIKASAPGAERDRSRILQHRAGHRAIQARQGLGAL